MPKAVQKDGRSDTLGYSSDNQTLKVIEDAVIAEYKKSPARAAGGDDASGCPTRLIGVRAP